MSICNTYVPTVSLYNINSINMKSCKSKSATRGGIIVEI